MSNIHLTREDVVYSEGKPTGDKTPKFIGQICITSDDRVYFANGLNNTNWIEPIGDVDKKIENELNMLEIGSSNFILNSDFIEKENTYDTDGVVSVSNGIATIKNATTFNMDLGTSFGALRRGDNISLSSIATLRNNSGDSTGLNKFIGGNINVFSEDHEYICSSVSSLKLNMITVPVAVSIENETSSTPVVELWALNRTKEYLRQLKSKNLIANETKLIFEPHPLVNGGEVSETLYNPSNKVEFFENWKNLIVNCLTELSDYKFYGIYVGTNFESFDTGEENIALWSKLIDEIKSIYKNHNIIYRTNWWTTASWAQELLDKYEEKVNNPLWEKVDIVSISSYFELNEKAIPTVDELYNDIVNGTTVYGRNQNIFNEVKKFYDVWKKPVMFGELGCPSKEFGASSPWDNLTENTDNQLVQSNLFEAYNRAFIYKNDELDNDWFLGYSIFTLGTKGSEFDVVGKEAQTSINSGIDFIKTNSNSFIQCYIRDKVSNRVVSDMKLPLSPLMDSVKYVSSKLIYDGIDDGELVFNIPVNATLTMSKPMLSVGKKPTTWCPSPQDPHNDIYYTKDEINSKIDEILQSVSDGMGQLISTKPKKCIGVFTKDSTWTPKLKTSIKKAYDIGIDNLILSITIMNGFDTSNPNFLIPPDDIRDLIRYSEGLGFKVTLKCHNLGEYDGLGNQLSPTNPVDWFKAYNTLVLGLADIAKEFNHTHFLISNEMHNVSNKAEWKSYWTTIVNNVKMRGLKVGSSVNTVEMFGNDGYQLWDELDFYGFNLYPCLSTKPYAEAIKNKKDLSKAFFISPKGEDVIPMLQGFTEDGKDMWVTECGCMPTDKGLETPAFWGDGSLPYNEEVQKTYYEIMLPILYNMSCLDLMTVWCGNEEDPFCFIGKQAEDVVKKYWGRG